MECVLILYPGENSYIGLWRPNATGDWVHVPVIRSAKRGTELYKTLEDFLQAQGIPLPKLTHIGVMHGPGSYTQLRTFIAAANSLAWALHLPLFSFPPEAQIPENLPELVAQAKVNHAIEPVYPAPLG